MTIYSRNQVIHKHDIVHVHILNLCLTTATKVSKIMVKNISQLRIQYMDTILYWPKAITYNFCDQLWEKSIKFVIFRNNIIDTDE